MFSIVCVYNNKNILDENLLRGLHGQSIPYELILVDNTKNEYHCAASALNYGANLTKNNYIMFVHQDVRFCEDQTLENIENILQTLGDFGVVGVAGKGDWRGTITNILHGDPPHPVGGITISRPTKVQTIDECLLIIQRELFNTNQFDAITCPDWHLYGVDFCLSAASLGYTNFVIPIQLYHASEGESMSKMYYRTLARVLKKHKLHYCIIYTTMGNWIVYLPVTLQKNRLWQGIVRRINTINYKPA